MFFEKFLDFFIYGAFIICGSTSNVDCSFLLGISIKKKTPKDLLKS